MMKKKRLFGMISFLFIVCLPIAFSATNYEVQQAFSLALLSPNTSSTRCQCMNIIMVHT